MKHIESRPSKSNKKDYEFYVDIDTETANSESVKLVLEDLKTKTSSVVLHTEESGIKQFFLHNLSSVRIFFLTFKKTKTINDHIFIL